MTAAATRFMDDYRSATVFAPRADARVPEKHRVGIEADERDGTMAAAVERVYDRLLAPEDPPVSYNSVRYVVDHAGFGPEDRFDNYHSRTSAAFLDAHRADMRREEQTDAMVAVLEQAQRAWLE